MKKQIDLPKALAIACIIFYAYVIIQIFTKNLAIDTDYPFHMHRIWAVSEGFLTMDPFLAGGDLFLLKYGAPLTLVGGLLYPLLGKYTVACLLAVAVPPLWYSSKKVFNHFSDLHNAKIAATIAVLNPLTVYYFLTSKLPFIWGVIFMLFSISFYLEGKKLPAAVVGVLAVFTHPLSLFLLGSLLIVKFQPKRWLKTYFLPLSIAFIQTIIFFGFFNRVTGGGGYSTLHLHNLIILTIGLIACFWLKEHTRFLSGLGIGFLGVWTALNGIIISSAYFNRIGFLLILLLIPALLKKTMSTFNGRKILIAPLVILLSAVGVYGSALGAVEDNPEAIQNINENILENTLKDGYVRYASDGSALYLLPLENVKLSNTGIESYATPPENIQTYEQMLEEDNVSYILVYESSCEDNMIQALDCPLLYSQENVQIYEVPKN